MLVEFKVGNFLSFKETVAFSMAAASIREHKDTHVFKAKNFQLLKSAVVYGANASGKTNLIKAISFMRYFVINSSKESQAEEKINVDRFKLSSETDKKPSFFEITFIHENIRYRYGFEVDKEKVHSEWFFYTKERETMLFTREDNHFELGRAFRKEGKELELKTRKNALFLSAAAQWNGEISLKIVKWFTHHLKIIYGLNKGDISTTVDLLEKDNQLKDRVLEFIKVADLGIHEVKIEKSAKADLVSSSFVYTPEIRTFHKKYDDNGKTVSIEEFKMERDESEGTKQLFSLIGLVINALNNGNLLIVDELDAQLHPLITNYIINLFNSTDKNPHNAQLIFNTHDTNFLSNKLFRRDQIWFAEKDRQEATDLYSLVEYNFKVRKDESYGKNYIIGKYGAIPFLGYLDTYRVLGIKNSKQ
jgi:AAA15 family ATPase/GTPase